MDENDVIEMYYLVESCKNNMNPRWNHQFDEEIDVKCKDFCEKHNINVTHGSPFKELRHKTYYYINKNIKSIIEDGVDLYGLRSKSIIKDKDIVEKLIKTRTENKLFIQDGKIGIYTNKGEKLV